MAPLFLPEPLLIFPVAHVAGKFDSMIRIRLQENDTASINCITLQTNNILMGYFTLHG